MRESFWLYLRNSTVGRRIRAYPRIARPLHAIGCRMLPEACKIRRGPCAGLVLEPSPWWPSDLWAGSYEPEVQDAVNEMLRPGSVFYDVGGGAGLFSLLGARKGAQVFVFEPHKENAQSVLRHAHRNGFENLIHIVPLAAHSKTGWLTLEFSQQGSQLAPMQGGPKQGQRALPVACTTLDEFATTHAPPNLVKIDVEGGESEVLKGADRLFTCDRPNLICEVHDRENETFVREWLVAKQYNVRWMETSGHERHILAKPHNAGAG